MPHQAQGGSASAVRHSTTGREGYACGQLALRLSFRARVSYCPLGRYRLERAGPNVVIAEPSRRRLKKSITTPRRPQPEAAHAPKRDSTFSPDADATKVDATKLTVSMRRDTNFEEELMRSIRRMFMVLAVSMGLAVAGLVVSSHENPALAAQAKSSQAKSSQAKSSQAKSSQARSSQARSSQARAGRANSGPAGRSGFEHQQCTWEDPCKIYNF